MHLTPIKKPRTFRGVNFITQDVVRGPGAPGGTVMHPDTEEYLDQTSTRLFLDRLTWAQLQVNPLAERKWLRKHLVDRHRARVARFLRSLRDWPQPGRPA